MAWFVEPRQRKSDGVWHLTANSDEDGGFHIGCDHQHVTAKEAQECKEALVEIGKVTGFPYSQDDHT